MNKLALTLTIAMLTSSAVGCATPHGTADAAPPLTPAAVYHAPAAPSMASESERFSRFDTTATTSGSANVYRPAAAGVEVTSRLREIRECWRCR